MSNYTTPEFFSLACIAAIMALAGGARTRVLGWPHVFATVLTIWFGTMFVLGMVTFYGGAR